MSTVLTMTTLQSRSDYELQTLIRKAQYDLACSANLIVDQPNILRCPFGLITAATS